MKEEKRVALLPFGYEATRFSLYTLLYIIHFTPYDETKTISLYAGGDGMLHGLLQ